MNAPAHSPATRTTCPYCGVGCGLLVRPDGRGGATVVGDPQHPANLGGICSKGAALGETLGLDGRLLYPLQRRADGSLARIGWDAAIDAVADGFRRVIARDGPDAVAFYLSGQLLTEDYYVANKLMKGFIGSANVDTNSRLCMSSSVAGHRRAFGADTVPGLYADLDTADLIVLVGSNAAWCHPVLFQRMVRNKSERGTKIVVIDPRRTTTADEADLFLAIEPGMDSVLFCGLLVHLAASGARNASYIATHTNGCDAALARARELAPNAKAVARATGLPEADVASFFDLFRATARTVTCYSQGVNQSAQGTDKVNAIINCHLATGRIGRPGAGPFSLTGQPNAMGGREVGGLANQLAAHMGFDAADVDRVGRFWRAPRMARREGLKAVQMFEAIARGEIKALWVMATNPAVSLPRAGAVRDALARLDLFVVSENMRSTDTANAGAHLMLPAAAWGEKGGTVTNSERRMSRQRAFLSLPGEARPDWWIVTQVAQRMGFGKAFDYTSPADIFREHAALSAFENGGTRDFDIGALAELSDAHYAALDPVQWPLRTGDAPRETRFFAAGGFFTADGKARFVAPERPELKDELTPDAPLRLNTGRIRDQWHTMTRSGKSPRLADHLPEPFVEVHPRDAAAFGLTDGEFAHVATAHGNCVVKVVVTDAQRPGSIFVPIHWNGETASCARVGDLVAGHTDPHSGQPEAKATAAAIAPATYPLRGVLHARHAVDLPPGTWWARSAKPDGVEYRFATWKGPMQWHDFADRLRDGDAVLADRIDMVRRIYQAATFVDGAIETRLYVGPDGAPMHWQPLAPPMQAGTPIRTDATDLFLQTGTVVCACFGVTESMVRDAVASGAVKSVGEIGEVLQAGTNCGSCRPELKKLLNAAKPARRNLSPA
jgi:assimilatory nitrate reductase catalytic subunit